MDAFETIVAQFLQEEGYWVRHSVKVDVSKADKVKIGLFSMPRPEIDVVVYNAKENELLLIEVKSFLDSPGVRFDSVAGRSGDARRYRLFTDKIFRSVVSKRLKSYYLKKGLINKNTKLGYGLAAGKICSNDEAKITHYFSRKGWKFFSPSKIKERIKALSSKGWEDNVVTLTAKLIMRGETQ